MFNRVFNFNQNRSLRGGLPQMGNPVNVWSIPLTLIKIEQKIVDGDLVQSERVYQFAGCIQPFRTEDLLAKPEGQRTWSYYWVHTTSTLPFQISDKIKYQNVKYKVTGIKNYDIYGYKELEVILDYQ